jgi:multidrug resistance efflux pump
MKKRSIRIIVPLLIVLTVVVVLLIHFFSGNKEAAVIRVTGIIDGIEVNLASKVAGRISSICCNEGETVKEGQTAVTLESEDIKASVEQALAAVERAKADIKTAQALIENARANILGAEGDMKSASADADKSRTQMEEYGREAERAKELFAKNFISRESRDQAVTAYESSVASYDSSKEKLSAALARKKASEAQLRVAVSQLDSSKAALSEAEANVAFYRSKLDDTVIRAPVTGIVIFKSLEKGETVSPGVTILTVVDLRSLYARVDIDETKIGGVVLNGPASVTVDGLQGRVFKGRISEIGRYAEFATQRDVVRGREDIKTFRVKVRVDDPSGILKPGMTVEVAIPRKT